MSTTTTTPTIDELQHRIESLREEKAELEEGRAALEDTIADLRDDLDAAERDDQETSERFTDRARQVLLDHHDDARHRGSQRFCTEAPCPAFNALLDESFL